MAALEGTTVTIPCAAGGPDANPATRLSVLILDKAYIPGNLNSAGILSYTALQADGTFELPAGCGPDGWGTDYHVYIFAANVGGALETDYASIPVPVNVPGCQNAAFTLPGSGVRSADGGEPGRQRTGPCLPVSLKEFSV